MLELVIERPVAGGRMLARHAGGIALVSGAIPGERVRARVERVSRNVLWADVAEVLDASPDRRAPPCDPRCGGAAYAHIACERQRELKAQIVVDAFRRIGKMTLDAAPRVAASPETGYRLRARFHVRGGRVGFFREGSHAICDPAPTRQVDPSGWRAAQRLAAVLGGRLAECESIVLAEDVAAELRVLHLLPAAPGGLRGLRLNIAEIEGVTGVTQATAAGFAVLGGDPVVADTAAVVFGADPPIAPSVVWRRGPCSFFQANRFLLGPLLRTVLAAAEADRCVDLYAGVGLFAVSLAARGSRVIAVEGDSFSARDLMSNARDYPSRLAVVAAPVEAYLRRAEGDPPDVVILDPPRTGASPEALDGVLRLHVPRIVYVSCDPPTLARDAARLTARGYRLESADAFDLFPNTPHVEVVAAFTSSRARRSP